MARIGDSEAVPILRHTALYDITPDVRAAAEGVLARWAAGNDARGARARDALAEMRASVPPEKARSSSATAESPAHRPRSARRIRSAPGRRRRLRWSRGRCSSLLDSQQEGDERRGRLAVAIGRGCVRFVDVELRGIRSPSGRRVGAHCLADQSQLSASGELCRGAARCIPGAGLRRPDGRLQRPGGRGAVGPRHLREPRWTSASDAHRGPRSLASGSRRNHEGWSELQRSMAVAPSLAAARGIVSVWGARGRSDEVRDACARTLPALHEAASRFQLLDSSARRTCTPRPLRRRWPGRRRGRSRSIRRRAAPSKEVSIWLDSQQASHGDPSDGADRWLSNGGGVVRHST